MAKLRSVFLSLALLTTSAAALSPSAVSAQSFVGVSVRFAPPPLPFYVQPPLPADGYIWAPGYWAWDDDEQDYYWVPGTWVLAPRPGYLWTPAWWGWNEGVYVFHSGYWGPHVGFYGGVNYGYGYGGFGYQGGYWSGRSFFYNRSVNRITNVSVTNVYNQTIVNRTTVNNISYNGGPGGVAARPTAQERSFASEPHVAPTPLQSRHVQVARGNPALFAAANRGAPPIAATARAAQLQGPGVVPTRRPTPSSPGTVGYGSSGPARGHPIDAADGRPFGGPPGPRSGAFRREADRSFDADGAVHASGRPDQRPSYGAAGAEGDPYGRPGRPQRLPPYAGRPQGGERGDLQGAPSYGQPLSPHAPSPYRGPPQAGYRPPALRPAPPRPPAPRPAPPRPPQPHPRERPEG